jgi:ribosomal protein S18 acetylase RimI-like enzyme
MELTRGRPEDIDELRPLWLELFHHHAEVVPETGRFTDDARSWQHRAALYREWLAEPLGFVLIARDGGGPLGYAMVRVREPDDDILDTWEVGDHVAELETLVVAAASRGRGIGTALLDAVDQELRRLGVRDLAVGVLAGNEEALRLYQARGFRPRMLHLVRELDD